MQLIIDIGNTRAKVAVFNSGKIISRRIFKKVSYKILKPLIAKYEIDAIIFSSVSAIILNEKSFRQNGIKLIKLTEQTKIPVKNKYTTPATLGKDRLANAVGAAFINPNKNNLVIDTGTCLKIDFVNAKNEYMGGAISPGLQMRYKALHHFTDKLPEISPSKKLPALIGNSTQNAIHSGVQQGMLAEINGAIDAYKRRYRNLHVYLTGGDASYFEPQLKKAIFAPDLTLYGLNEILRFSTKK